MGVNALMFDLEAACMTLDDPELDERLDLLELFPHGHLSDVHGPSRNHLSRSTRNLKGCFFRPLS